MSVVLFNYVNLKLSWFSSHVELLKFKFYKILLLFHDSGFEKRDTKFVYMFTILGLLKNMYI